jgi:nitrogen-specific signal transduction histidine kinase/FixJ family two-component response regulator
VTREETHDGLESFVVTLDDITDLVIAQRSTAWADVARRIAHEIKNPLTPIQLSAERIRRRYGKQIPDEDRAVFDQCTNTIVRQVEDIGRMVDEFSSFARMPKPSKVRTDLRDILKDAAFLREVSRSDIDFRNEFPDFPLEGEFDPRMLGQAFGNLVKNATEAIDAVPSDQERSGKIIILRASLSPDEREYVIDIIDNGRGLPGENRHRLLEPYMTMRDKGTGLGLAIVKKIIDDHGGTIQLRDAPSDVDEGRGAMITVRLPVDAQISEEQEETKGSRQMASDILVVDDEADIRDIVSGILDDEGHETRTAADSDSALAAISDRVPRLIFLDIWLQGSRLDGLALLDEIKARYPDLPVVMISGHGNIETAVSAIQRGAYDFIEKPFKADRLLLVAERALETSNLKREVTELKKRSGDPAELIGTSVAVSQLKQTIDKIAPTNSRVMILGPSGSGKELVARLIHRKSSRAGGPFVVLNAAAITPERMEVALFGTESAASHERKVGALEEAHGGILYLDEVADMPRGTQNKILGF